MKLSKEYFENGEIRTEVRINKYLSDAGMCSRREADQLVEAGKVLIDGIPAVMGSRVLPGQKVTISGKTIEQEKKLALIAFHKPKGIVCTTDRREPDNIVDFIQYGSRIFPIGRLDKSSEGLILLTNDGAIVNKILRAGNEHEKEYIVQVNKPLTQEFLQGMADGVPILDTVTKPCTVEMLSKDSFRIVLTQGLNRQIRRMCEYFDYRVLALVRVRIMNIKLGRLKPGTWRNLTEWELEELNELLKSSVNQPVHSEKSEKLQGKAIFKEKLAEERKVKSSKKVLSAKKISIKKTLSEKDKAFRKRETGQDQKASGKRKYQEETSSFEKDKVFRKWETGQDQKVSGKRKYQEETSAFERDKSFQKRETGQDRKVSGKRKYQEETSAFERDKSFQKRETGKDQKASGKRKYQEERSPFEKDKAFRKQETGRDQKTLEKRKYQEERSSFEKDKAFRKRETERDQKASGKRKYQEERSFFEKDRAFRKRETGRDQKASGKRKYQEETSSFEKDKTFRKRETGRDQKASGKGKYQKEKQFFEKNLRKSKKNR